MCYFFPNTMGPTLEMHILTRKASCAGDFMYSSSFPQAQTVSPFVLLHNTFPIAAEYLSNVCECEPTTSWCKVVGHNDAP